MKIVHDIPFLHRENDKQQEERHNGKAMYYLQVCGEAIHQKA